MRTVMLGFRAVAVLALSGCSWSPSLVDTPFVIKETPAIVRFDQPVASSGPAWELCYEFRFSGDSHQAGRIQAALVATSGRRYRFVESELDRRGEAIVCRVGRLAPADANGPSPTVSGPIEYEGVEVSCEIPLSVRGLRGGSLP